MSRLPIVGQDDNVWGQVLNDFLIVAHNTDGTLQSSAVAQAGAYQKPNGGIPASDLSTSVQSSISNAANAISTVNGVSAVSGNVTLSAGDMGAYTTSQIDASFANTDAVILYNSTTSSYPVRASVTTSSTRPVRWRGPIAPTIGGSYAIDGLDVWEMTAS